MQVLNNLSKSKIRTAQSGTASVQPSLARQGGAVLIMVVSLMTTLVVLGIFFYGLTEQELSSAEFFAAKEPVEIDPDPIFDTVLRQAIVGPNQTEFQSALYGGHYAMLATIFGRPVVDGNNVYYQPHPYTGRGIQVTADTDNDGTVDFSWDLSGDSVNDIPGAFNVNYGGATTHDQDEFIINFSPAANGGTAASVGSQFNSNPGYTYPDLNSLFLAVDDMIPNEANDSIYRLVMPSYFRPQMFTRRRFAGFSGFGTYNDSTINPMGSPSIEGIFEENDGPVNGVTVQTRNKVLRPHVGHRAIDSSGNVIGARFTDSAATAQSGDQNRIIAPFPFEVHIDDDDGDGEIGDSGDNANEMGLFNTEDQNNVLYEYDGDVDRDGVRDAILLDVGHDIINLPNGRQVVPLAMMKWIDNDGLLNVNAHGNMQRLVNDQTPINDSNGIPFSASNQGLSSFEVNLGLGLTADPMSNSDIEQTASVKNRVFVNHNGMYGFNPNSRQEASNAELLRLLTGSFVYDRYGGTVTRIDSTYPIVGRYGNVSNPGQVTNVESALSGGQLRSGPPNWASASVPKPGGTGADDDEENDDGMVPDDEPIFDYVKFGHPLDHFGVGDASEAPSSGTDRGNRRRLIYDGTSPDVLIPRMAYDEDWVQSRLPNAYEPSPKTAITDEPDETIVEPSMRTTTDTLFETAELFSLHASDADLAYSSIQSRLMKLASFNFRDSRRAAEIRKRFTTDSWDRLEFSHRPELSGDRSWEFNAWNLSGGGIFTQDVQTPSDDLLNPMDTTAVQFNRAFPPQFGSGSGDTVVYGAADPFRANLRTLLATRLETTPSTTTTPVWNALRNSGVVGQRLNINRYLSGFRANGAPIYERLTEHPTGLAATPPNPGDPEDDARIERQRLARDIYVLLYILGGEKDSVNYTTSDATNGHTDEQMKDMAQFAVNVVDALDPDNVTTRFKYDTNLSDGWNLNDDPYDDEGPDPDYAFVDGVEEHQVTLSEAMFVFSEGDTPESRTEWNDTLDHSFAYLELFNTGLSDVDWDNEWQVRLEIPQVGSMTADHFRELTLDTGTLNRGGFFTIGSADKDLGGMGTALNDALMEIQDSSMAFQVVAPASGSLDLDLVDASSGGMATGFTLVDPNGDRNMGINAGGDFFPYNVASALESAGGEIRVILRKRANLQRTAPSPTFDTSNASQQSEQDDNPWIEVDRMEITVVADTSDNGFVDFNVNQLGAVESIERKEPFNRQSETQSVGGETGGMADPVKQNSLGEFNVDTTPSPSEFDLWQVHFNRDFSSIAELLSIPLYGPDELTMQLGEHVSTLNSRLSGFYDDLDTGQYEPSVAGSLILFPDPAVLTNMPFNLNQPTNWTNGNRWHRLFEFLQVVPQNLERIGDYNRTTVGDAIPIQRRVPGKINLNMVRHESVLAGLIDDAMIDRFGDAPTQSTTHDNGMGFNNRNWFRELMRSREPVDHFLLFRSGFQIRLPGVPDSHPFMSSSYFDQYGEAAIQAFTPFRKNAQYRVQPVPGDMTYDMGALNEDWRNIGLFDARDSSDVGEDTVDYHTRHRIFSKVFNNTTNRSHVFSGWIEIAFHEAHEIDDGSGNTAVQLGAEAEDLPRYRLFCVVDLSRLEEAYDPNTGTFDYQKFIIHRQQLPD